MSFLFLSKIVTPQGMDYFKILFETLYGGEQAILLS